MEKQLDGPLPRVPEAIRQLDWRSQNVENVALDGERDHREWECDRRTDCRLL
jgi:hypothetical protein